MLGSKNSTRRKLPRPQEPPSGSTGRAGSSSRSHNVRVAGSVQEAMPELVTEREALVERRQHDLESLIDRHDDLVREAFHLEKFVTLLHYDPKVAKEDRSVVFQEYKEKYELVAGDPTPGPSRQTRRAHNERLVSFKAAPGPHVSPDKKVKLKRRLSAPSKGIISTSSPVAKHDVNGLRRHRTSLGLPSQIEGKGKERNWGYNLSNDTLSGNTVSSGHRSTKVNGKSKTLLVPSAQSGPSGDGRDQVSHVDDPLPFAHGSPPSSRPSHRTKRSEKLSTRVSEASLHSEALPFPHGVPEPAQTKRRRRDQIPLSPMTHQGTERTTRQSHRFVENDGPSGVSSHDRKTVGGKTVPATNVASTGVGKKHKADEELPSLQSRIKRVKLTLRVPPPLISHPAHRPPPPKYGKSLTSFLSSYITIDGVDYDSATLEQLAMKEGKLLNRIEDLKNEGRLLLDSQAAAALLGIGDHGVGPPSTLTSLDSGLPTDSWSTVVKAVILRAKEVKGSKGQRVAAQVAGKVRSYWEGMALKEDKTRANEEKRLRALAKATMKLVTNEWKKAIFHIREQQRLIIEAEEKRLGRQHLDAILNQSGQILEAQQLDFTKAGSVQSRSRSSSTSFSSDGSAEDSFEQPGDSEAEDQRDAEEEMQFRSDGDEAEPIDEEPEFAEVDASLTLDDHASDYGSNSEYLNDERITPSGWSSQGDAAEGSGLIEDPDIGIHVLFGSRLADIPSRMDSVDQSVRSSLNPSVVALEDEDTSRYDVTPVSFPDDSMVEHEPTQSATDTTALQTNAKPIVTLAPVISVPPPFNLNVSPSISQSPTSITSNSNYPRISSIPVNDDSLVLRTNGSDRKVHGDVLPEDNGLFESDVYSKLDLTGIQKLSNEVYITAVPSCPNGDIDLPVAEAPEDTFVDLQDIWEGPEEVLLDLDRTIDNEIAPGIDTTIDDTEGRTTNTSEKPLTSVQEGRELPQEESTMDFEANDQEWEVPHYLEPYAVARVDWDTQSKVKPPLLLRGTLRPYQQSGLEWLASLHINNLNGILADEMGLGKTIQTIALLAHLACDRGIWGPHLIIVPTSVLLNWEMEFKKFLPGFKILSYHGGTKRRKELRQGWNNRHAFNVCVTSYSLASRDAHIFKRKAWYYMILDEAHMIKNFKSQRWNILLMFRSFRRLLLTGTPLQNNLTELWALLQFLMSGTNFANVKQFGEWFSNPLEKAIEQGNILDEETQQRVTKLHTVLRPYLLRRLKRDVEKELPSKYEHLVLCRLSKRQRFLYDEFITRAQTQDDLQSGIYQKVANILMQLRKVCNHPDLFEVRPIVTSFAMERSAIADFEIKELLVRRRLLSDGDQSLPATLDVLGLRFSQYSATSLLAARETRYLGDSLTPSLIVEHPGEPPLMDLRTIEGYRRYTSYQQRSAIFALRTHMAYLNHLRCNRIPVYGRETIDLVKRLYPSPWSWHRSNLSHTNYLDKSRIVHSMVKSYPGIADEMADLIDRFAFATPAVIARDLPKIALAEVPEDVLQTLADPHFDAVLHRSSVKLQIAFPDSSLLQYDCGKLQELAHLLRVRKSGGHRVLIFTQMTKVLDLLEIFLNFHGYLYLRLDGATKIEDRQYVTERFNADERVFAFIASSRSGGVGINLTGADTVIFYDSDFNPQMDRQCEDRAHRIGQIRDVHIYRFVSAHTVEEAMLRKANQKRSLDDMVIQQGEFDWRGLFGPDDEHTAVSAIEQAMAHFEDDEDAHAAQVAAREEAVLEGEDKADFADVEGSIETSKVTLEDRQEPALTEVDEDVEAEMPEEEEEGGTITDYMLSVVRTDPDFFKEWRL